MRPIERLRTLPTQLRETVIGQDQAIATVAERLQHGELGLAAPGRPKASFLFLGPTGVGKTELSLRFTEHLIGRDRLVRLDMSEYQTPDRLGLLLGSSVTDPGRMAEEHSRCGGFGTLLCDEIEKAHPRVLNILLQLLDAGRLTTGANRVLDFSGWYCVLTSNIGAQQIAGMRRSKYETMERLVRHEAQRDLSPELFARITAVVVFNKLDYDALYRIAEALVRDEVRAQRDRGHELTVMPGVVDLVLRHGYDEALGARPMRNAAERLIRNAIAHDLLDGGVGCGRLRADPAGMKIELQPTARAAAA